MRSGDEVRPRTFTEEARRAQIVACTIDTLAELGYADTSFARVAERAGISKSVISYYFAGKEELLRRVVEQVLAEAAAYMMPRIEAAGESARATLAVYLRSNLEFIRDHGDGITAVTEIVLGARAARRAPGVAGGLDRALKPLQDILSRGQERGEFTAFDTRTMAWSIRGLIDGVHRRRIADPEFDFDRGIDELAALVDRATRRLP